MNKYPDDIYEHMDNLLEAMGNAKTIDEARAAWHHFDLLEGYIERTWPSDRQTIASCRRLKSGLSQYTSDIRENMPSPYTGWHVELTALRSLVRPQYDKDGWPI